MKYNSVVILADAGIGDFVWATSALALIRDYDKDIEIILVTSDKYIDLIDKRLSINKIVTTNNRYHVSKNKIVRFCYKLFWSVKNFKYFYKKDVCLFLDISMFFTITSKYLYGIKNIIGPNNFAFGYNLINKSAKYYTKQVVMPLDSDRNSFMMRYQCIVRAVFPTYNLAVPVLPDTNHLSEKIKKIIGTTKKYKIALAPCASVTWRSWNIEYLKKLIEVINKNFEVSFFIFGSSKNEKNYALSLIDSLPKDINIKSMVNKTSLLELKEFLKNMDLLISVDTGIIHLAAVMNIPIISLHGANLPENSGAITSKVISLCSYRNCAPCTYKTVLNNFVCKNIKCMQDIKPETVFEKIKEILN